MKYIMEYIMEYIMRSRKILILLVIITLIIIIYEIIRLKTLLSCPKPIIEYRYVPRTFKDEQNEPIPIEDIFNAMFSKPSPWMMSRGIGERSRLDTRLDGRSKNFV
jgi:hypothetical protein